MLAGAWNARTFVALLGAAWTLVLGVASASAAPPLLLTQFPEGTGSGANQLRVPRALATDPDTGHVFVAESANNRISEFDAWGVFVKAWGWGVSTGVGAPQTCGPAEPEVSPPAAMCQKGIAGSGAGQLQEPNGVAVDSNGNVYVLERLNLRVQKFNSAGQFVLMFGGEVNKTTGGNVCTAASGDTCGVGVKGTGSGEFEPKDLFFVGNYLTVAPDGTVYVGDKDRIQHFDAVGSFLSQLPLPKSGYPGSLSFDPASDVLYLAYLGLDTNPPIYKLDPGDGKVLDTLESGLGGAEIEGLAVNNDGSVLVSINPVGIGSGSTEQPRVVSFGSSGDLLISPAEEFAAPTAAERAAGTTELLGLATNGIGNVYVGRNYSATSIVSAYGPPPTFYGPPPKVPPVILEQFASAVDTVGATLKARINPKFWSDTRYYVEYGLADCDTSICTKKPAAPGQLLTTEVVNAPLSAAGILLIGLTPATTYHYRFVSESGGGGPVFGIDRTFTTSPLAPKQPPCPPNEAFRIGPGALLPDCRAYEMVSPIDKNGADISTLFNALGDRTGLNKFGSSGDKLTFSAYRAFGEVESAPYTVQYMATRGGSGWSSKGISPPKEGASLYGTIQLDTQFKGFTDDLCQSWLLQDTDLSLAEGSLPGWPGVYRRDLCAGEYSFLAPETAPTVEVNEFRPELQGYSEDGSVVIFRAAGKLTNNAQKARQLYEVDNNGKLRLVCILPTKAAYNAACSGGMEGTGGVHPERSASLSNTISDDGSVIYWTASNQGPGSLYARINHNETVAVSEGSAQFWTASTDGSRAIYSSGGGLFEFDLATATSESLAGGFQGVLGASDDAAKVYFASSEVLDAGASAGQPNLYLYEAGEPDSFEFIATLSARDVSGTHGIPSNTDPWPIRRVARVTPDGAALAFISSASLTGYDNVDVNSAQADAEVFLYRAGPDSLACVSCLRTGARPNGRNIKDEHELATDFWAAAQLPAAENQIHFPNVLAEDGTRLYFESFDPLALRDTNKKQDVYQWEAEGAGNCTTTAPGYDAALGGCVNLISSGESPQDSEIVDVSADGRDVFFKTTQSLLPQDPGLVDIYDARAGGGFPIPVAPPEECEGEACQHPAPPPNDPSPSSQNYQGPPDPKPQNPPKKCPKGKHKQKNKAGKTVCVKNKKKKGKNANKNKAQKSVGASR